MSLRDEYENEAGEFVEVSSYGLDAFTREYVEWLERKLEEERFIKNITKLKVNDLYMYLKGGK